MQSSDIYKEEPTCLYYEVYMFPNYERRIIWFPKPEQPVKMLTDQELIDYPLLPQLREYFHTGQTNKYSIKIDGAFLLPKQC